MKIDNYSYILISKKKRGVSDDLFDLQDKLTSTVNQATRKALMKLYNIYV